ncbi:MATE family efflux transporter [Clostridium sp.]|jgi:putative MATE family efflux protein|uniref:MATE family efflux transporter n=1 Tax=Clostridium sp. TaxID=1506 RepID=UPI003EF0737D
MSKNNSQLGTEKISKLLLKLSLPATIGMLVTALYNIIDTIFVGQWVSLDAIGGLAIAFPIQMLIMAFAQMIGIGSASVISRNLGENNIEKAEHVAGNSFLAISVLSIFFVTFGLAFTEPILKVFGATNTLLPYAKDYISIIFIGSVFFSFTVSSNNLVRAEGNAKVAMISMLLGAGINILLDPIFIKVLDLGIKGAALATIISQFASFTYLIIYLYSGKTLLKVKLHHIKPKISIIKEIVSMGLAPFSRQVAGSIVAIILNNSLKIYGGASVDLQISILGIINRITMMLYMPLFGIAQGLQPIVGFNYGAKNSGRIKEVIKLALITTTTLASMGFIVSQSIPELIMKIFNDDPQLTQTGSVVLRIAVAMLPLIGLQMVGSTVFQSIGKALPALILSLSRQVLFFIPLVLILPRFMGIMGIWISFPIADLSSAIVTGIMLKKELKNIPIDLKIST